MILLFIRLTKNFRPFGNIPERFASLRTEITPSYNTKGNENEK